MKKLLVFLALIPALIFGQASKPRSFGNAYLWLDWIENGEKDFTYIGTITFDNDAALENEREGKFSLTFNADSTILGELFIVSAKDTPDVAVNDNFKIHFTAYNDSAEAINYVTIEAVVLDETDATEDGRINFKVITAGSQTTPLYLSGSDATVAGKITAATADITLAADLDSAAIRKAFIASHNFYADTSTSNDNWGFEAQEITAYITGLELTLKIAVENTDGATLQINALGAKNVTKAASAAVSTALATGDVIAGQIIKVVYDGTQFQIISRLAQ